MRSARAAGCFLSRATRSRRPTTMPAWGPPRSLSPENSTRSAPAAATGAPGSPPSHGGGGWQPRRALVEQPRADVVDQRHASSLGQTCQLGERHLGDEAHDPIVGLVDLQEESRLVDVGVVGEPGAVGGPDLHQSRTGRLHQLREAVGAADLDQLSSRNRDRPARSQGRQSEEDRPGVVVEDEGRLGAGERHQETLESGVPCARSPVARSSSVLSSRATSAAASAASGASGPSPGWCGAGPGGADHPAGKGPADEAQPPPGLGFDVERRVLPCPVDHVAHRLHDQRPRHGAVVQPTDHGVDGGRPSGCHRREG